MKEANRLGDNIKSLRKAYGETQERFGRIIGVEKNTVSFYETGNRVPPKETLSAIAKHFMVSVDELLNSDFSNMGKVDYDFTVFFRNVGVFFPLISSEKAMKNRDFEEAISLHKEMYSKVQRINLYDLENFDGFDNIDVCWEKYMNSYEDELAKEVSAANILALWYLLLMEIKSSAIETNYKTAIVEQWKKNNSLFKEVFEESDQAIAKEAGDLWKELLTSEEKKDIDHMMILLKKSSSRRLSDLADYYLALQYLFDIVDDDLTVDFNRRIGAEMLSSFMSVGNKYAKRLIMQYFS